MSLKGIVYEHLVLNTRPQIELQHERTIRQSVDSEKKPTIKRRVK